METINPCGKFLIRMRFQIRHLYWILTGPSFALSPIGMCNTCVENSFGLYWRRVDQDDLHATPVLQRKYFKMETFLLSSLYMFGT
jgi:hypothetical protein